MAEQSHGYSFKNNKKVPNLEVGKIIEDASVAKKILPSEEGFFFGCTDYDQYYYDELVNTRDVLDKVLAETGEEFQYHSSW